MRDMPRHARGREPAAGVALSREGCSACARTPRIARSAMAGRGSARGWVWHPLDTQGRFARVGRMARAPIIELLAQGECLEHPGSICSRRARDSTTKGRFARAGRVARPPRVDLFAQGE